MENTENNNVKNLGEAISVLIQAANIAQSKGVYSFQDSAKIASALAFIDAANAAANEQANSDGPKAAGGIVVEETDKSSAKK